jgi:LuxR family maltose regulon positive regulatory protein
MATSAAIAATVGSGRQTAGVGDPLLTSKVTVPSIPDWLLERPRIDRLIAAGARGSITTVTGPPGAGKTMALALWAASSPAESMTAWVTIDDHDNQPRVFWSYVLEALRRSGVPVPRALTATARRYAVDHEFLLRFASLMAAQDPPVVLVLDDAHLLTGAKVLDGLAYVLKHAAPGLRLVVASRMDPLLPLHRYRLTGELTEVRASDLAFTVPESCRLVAQHGVGLSAESLDSLTRRAEGWAAVLRLAAISMGGHPDPDQFVKELVAEDSAVAGYLVEEVLNVQPPPVRTSRLRTSILDRISEELAAEVAGEGSDAAVLPDLAHVNALVQRDDGGWYHYHSLFAAVLRLKLRREDPGRLQELHLRAAGWLRRNGYLADAVRHAASAGDWELAARTVVDELAIGELIEPEGSEALADGFRDMPRDLRWTTPQPLLVASAIDLVRGEGALSGAFVCAAEDMLGRLPAETETPSRLAAALIRIALARRSGNLTAAAAAAGAAQSLIDAIPQDQHARHPWNQSKVVAGRGAVELWSGRFDDAAAIFTTGAVTARMPRAGYDRADFLGHLALIEALQGRLAHAEELATESAGGAGKTPALPRPRMARRWRWPRCTWTGTNLRRPTAGRSGPRRPCTPGRTSCSAWRPASSRRGRAWPRAAARRRWSSPAGPGRAGRPRPGWNTGCCCWSRGPTPPPLTSSAVGPRCGRRSPRSAQRSRWPMRCFLRATGRAPRGRSPVRRPVTTRPSVPGWRHG